MVVSNNCWLTVMQLYFEYNKRLHSDIFNIYKAAMVTTSTGLLQILVASSKQKMGTSICCCTSLGILVYLNSKHILYKRYLSILVVTFKTCFRITTPVIQ